MSNKPYRLAQGGSRIDRAKKLHFSFDGKQLTGFTGDTLASAVMANGTKLFGRSFKYHRPRGVVGLGSEEMNALVGVGDGSRHEPNLRATQVELFDGLQAVSQNRWPTLAFDVGSLNSKFSRFIPGGFYYKTSCAQRFGAVYEPIIRKAAAWAERLRAAIPIHTKIFMCIAMCWWWAAALPDWLRPSLLRQRAPELFWPMRTHCLVGLLIFRAARLMVSRNRPGLPRRFPHSPHRRMCISCPAPLSWAIGTIIT